MERAALDALVITPGADMRYLAGYQAKPLERLTAFLVGRNGEAMLIAPELEAAEAHGSKFVSGGGLLVTYSETGDPWNIVEEFLKKSLRIGVDPHMWADRVLTLQQRFPGAQIVSAGPFISELRVIKSPDEISALMEAGAAIDRVHARIPQMLRAGRTEREVGRDIASAIIEEGHVNVDFVIVGSGPNGASPHHSVSDRVIGVGEPIVIDIGGTMPSGFCSDSTRMYCIGEPPRDFMGMFTILLEAQSLARDHAAPGVSCESVDSAARDHLASANLGDFFIHRTGHGIGLETHEEPYIVQGNTQILEPGMAFSIEPGFYVPGRYGARIEDIVICGAEGAIPVNHRPREICII
jgi:Xaa-Pro aminopeptidase